MERVTIDIDDTEELATPVGIAGAIRATEAFADGTFEYIVGVVAVVYASGK